MSYNSGINQKILNQTFYNNISIDYIEINEINLDLISNLEYVQNWGMNILNNYLTINNPTFYGVLSGDTININNNLSVSTITSNTNFLNEPTINNNQIETNIIGEIMISLNKTPPQNYILCNGDFVPISQYQKLYNVIGNIYGYSNGINFTLPNFISKFPIGSNSSISSLGKTVPASNFNGGNISTSSNFGGSSSSIPPILSILSTHNHDIIDPTHAHLMPFSNSFNVQMEIGQPPYAGAFSTLYLSSDFPNPYNTNNSDTNIIINNIGDNIEELDTISNLNGVNVSNGFISVYYFICYN
jgi:hypothetical protein